MLISADTKPRRDELTPESWTSSRGGFHVQVQPIVQAVPTKASPGRVAPDLLQRQFTAERMNQKWTTDATEFNVAGEKLYLPPVIDLYNGEIVASKRRDDRSSNWSRTCRQRLHQIDDSEKPILHSDQGWHDRMPAGNRMLESRNIAQSMSRKGHCLDVRHPQIRVFQLQSLRQHREV
ncbi:hypothetical protein ELH21_25800 (plasmid) [Rhizobium leguminosarum]|nr:DDE-type integrase/transposase/recombinase [Rhizobium leguminosarum]TBC91663.1 hypothetical protein ELH21_25800 [Rhizobium leguminosarum]